MSRTTSRRAAARGRGAFRAYTFPAPATPAKPDRRARTNNRAQQPPAECPVCRAQVRQKKATYVEAGEYARTPGTVKGDLIMGRHRFGGGSASGVTDIPCAGSEAKVTP